MSNFKILTNDIIYRTTNIIPNATCEPFFNEWNLLSNRKYHLTQFESSATSNIFSFDLGSGNTRASNFFCFNVNQIDLTDLVSIRLEGSSDNSSWSSIKTVLPADLVTLNGYYESDYVSTFATSTAYRYWRVVHEATTGRIGNYGKFYFGLMLDIGNPNDFKIRLNKEENKFISDAGFASFNKLKNDKRIFEVDFNLVSDANLESLEFILQNFKQPLIWFYNPTSNGFMDGTDLVSVNIKEFDITRQTNFNEIFLLCEEAI